MLFVFWVFLKKKKIIKFIEGNLIKSVGIIPTLVITMMLFLKYVVKR